MINFETINIPLTTVLSAIIIFMFIYSYKWFKLIRRIGEPKVITYFISNRITLMYTVPLFCSALVLSLLFAVNDIKGNSKEVVYPNINVHFILDNSLSMMAHIEAETRYSIMQKSTLGLITKRPDLNKVSCTYFSGEYYPVSPPTNDINVVKQIISKFENNRIGIEGSDLKNLDKYLNVLSAKDSTEFIEDVFILVSDGDMPKYPSKIDSGHSLITVCIGQNGENSIREGSRQIITVADPERMENLSTIGFVNSNNPIEITSEINQLINSKRELASKVKYLSDSSLNHIFGVVSLLIVCMVIILKW